MTKVLQHGMIIKDIFVPKETYIRVQYQNSYK